MKKNNLPKNWLVLNDNSQRFKDTVVAYLNEHHLVNNNFTLNVLEGTSPLFYGYNSKAKARRVISTTKEDDITYALLSISDFIELSKPIDAHTFTSHDGFTINRTDKVYWLCVDTTKKNGTVVGDKLWSHELFKWNLDSGIRTTDGTYLWFKELKNLKQYIIDNFKDDYSQEIKEYYVVIKNGLKQDKITKDAPLLMTPLIYNHYLLNYFKTEDKAQAYLDLVYYNENKEVKEIPKPVIKPLPPKYFAVLNDNIGEFRKYIAPFINESSFNYKDLNNYYGICKSKLGVFSADKEYILNNFPEVLREHYYTIEQFKALYVNDADDILPKPIGTGIGGPNKWDKLLTITEIKAILEKEYDKEDVTDIINLLNKE